MDGQLIDVLLVAVLLLAVLIGLSQANRLREFWTLIVLLLLTQPKYVLLLVVAYAAYKFFKPNSRK